jgi:GNAT superfamily N-acetyltransferase
MTVRVVVPDSALLERAVSQFMGGQAASVFADAPNTLVFVALDDADVAGWCWGYHLIRPDGTSMLYLHQFEVAEPHRRTGIGRKLLHTFMTADTRVGATKMFLTTGADNTAARSLYDAMGGGLASQGPTVNYWFLLGRDTPSGDDPNMAPYPRRYDVARLKGGAPNEEPVPLDITGTADLQEHIDSIGELLEQGPVPDGGLSWDAHTRTVVVRLVGPVDGTSPAVEQLKTAVLAKAEGFTVKFRSVTYSRAELEQLASRLFSTMHRWAPGLTHAGGGWSCDQNRVSVMIPSNTGQLEAWTQAIQALHDDRIVIEPYVYTPRPRRRGGWS